MVSLGFSKNPSAEKRPRDPSLYYVVAGATIRNAEAHIVAERTEASWTAEGQHFSALWFRGCLVRLEGDEQVSKSFGPYRRVTLTANSLYADGRLLARYSPKGYWRSYVHRLRRCTRFTVEQGAPGEGEPF